MLPTGTLLSALAKRLYRRQIPLPPLAMMREVGNRQALDDAIPGTFLDVGKHLVHHFKTLIGLEPQWRVLEVGCGCGRIARQLTDTLGRTGSYDGIDVMRSHLGWCANEISTRFANFHFWHANVYNSSYNPSSQIEATEYSFPFDDGFFDFVFLASVFTHMLPDDVEHYMAEISRVLRPGGRTLITYFLLNESSRAAIAAKTVTASFVPSDSTAYWLSNPSIPEQVVALDEDLVTQQHERHALRIDGMYYGSWTRREGAASMQDMIVATRAFLS